MQHCLDSNSKSIILNWHNIFPQCIVFFPYFLDVTPFTYFIINFLQIEQEMSLIYDRPDVRAQFSKQWLSFVTGIITYGGNSSVSILASGLDESGILDVMLGICVLLLLFSGGAIL